MIEALRHYGRSLLLAMWLGAGLFFAAVVAPGAFRVLPTSELAGRIVGHALTWLNITGILLSAVLIALTASGIRKAAHPRPTIAERLALLVMCSTLAATEFVINHRISQLRAGHEIASLAPTDPVRIEFGMLHGVSVVLFGAGVLAALVALLLIVRRQFGISLKRKEEKDSGNNRAPAAVAQQL